MTFDTTGYDPDLLDWHLHRLDACQEDALRARLGREPALAEQHAALSTALTALDGLRDLPPPAGLEARVAARVAAAPALRLRGIRDAARELERRGNEPIIRMQSMRDIAAVAAMIVLAVGVGVPSMLHLKERNQRIACAYNLGQIGQAMQAYAATFNDNLPFAGWSARASWRPTGDPAVEVIPNRQHIYPLVAGGLVVPQRFVCPATRDVPMTADQTRARRGFLEARNVSYAYQNMAGVRPSLHSASSLPVLGDNNPLFDDGLPLLDLRRLGLGDPLSANSTSHGGRGQNILTIDGRSIWANSPNVGVDGDNIWTLSNIRVYTGHEGPEVATDSHLLR
jgi:hypothetical protein